VWLRILRTGLNTRWASEAGNIASEISDAIQDMIGNAMQWGKDLVNAIVDGIEARVDAAGDAAGELAGEIRDHLPSSPAKKGPLSDLDKVGPGAVETVASGIEDNRGAASRFAGSMQGMSAGGMASGGETTVVFEKGAIVLQGSGSSRRDGQNVADWGVGVHNEF